MTLTYELGELKAVEDIVKLNFIAAHKYYHIRQNQIVKHGNKVFYLVALTSAASTLNNGIYVKRIEHELGKDGPVALTLENLCVDIKISVSYA